MTLLRPFSSLTYAQVTSSSTQTMPGSPNCDMVNTGFEAVAGLRKQIIENCYFFSSQSTFIGTIVSREHSGTYKATALRTQRNRRVALLSSESAETPVKALEQLLIKSADAVQQYVTTNGFGLLPSDIDDDDGVSSVGSYMDEPAKDRLADSSLTLNTEVDQDSHYDSLSEDDIDGEDVRYARARGTRRFYDEIAERRASSHSPRRPAVEEIHHTGRGGPIRPGRNPTQSGPGQRRRSSPPRPSTLYANSSRPFLGSVNGRVVSNYSGTQSGRPTAMPSRPPPEWFQPTPGPGYQQGPHARVHHCVIKASEDQGFVNLDLTSPPDTTLPSNRSMPLRSQPPHFFSGLGPVLSSMPPQWPHSTQQTPVVVKYHPQQQPPPQQRSPVKGASEAQFSMTHLPSIKVINRSEAPSSASSQTSSASTTPTLTRSPNAPPKYPPPPPSAAKKIDYRLIIRTFHAGPRGTKVEGPPHRMLAHGAPTRRELRYVALKHIGMNPEAFRRAGLNVTVPFSLSDTTLGAVVTRAVFPTGSAGAEESYDLAAYGEDDFTRLCESMSATGERDGKATMPLFEVVVTNV